jgi:hypothetical protein
VDWQQIVALLIVAAAVIWLIRTQILAPRREGGCGSCPGSVPRPSQKAGGTSQLVQIELELGGKREKPDG